MNDPGKRTGKRKWHTTMRVFITAAVMLHPVNVCAQDLNDLRNYVDGSRLTVFLPEEDYTDSSVSVQIGSSEILEGRLMPLESSGTVRTLILFDNSLSISPQNREKMKSLVSALVMNKRPEEEFAFAVFDTEVHLAAGMTSDADTILQALEKTEFQNQYTWLMNCLYDSIGDPELFARESYDRILVCSDGSEDNPLGYTREDVLRKLELYGCELMAAGSLYEEDPDAVSRLMSLARAARGAAWLLDDYRDDLDEVAEEIRGEMPSAAAVAELPERILDGSEKRVQIRIRTESGCFTGAATVQMPFSETAAQTAVDEPVREGPEETSDAAEVPVTDTSSGEAGLSDGEEEKSHSQDEKETGLALPADAEREEEMSVQTESPKSIWQIPALCIPPAAAAAVVLILQFLKRKKKEGASAETDEETEDPVSGRGFPDEEYTVLQEKDDDERTVLMEKTAAARCMLTLSGDPDSRPSYTVPVLREVLVGRKPDCTIVLRGDSSVSGHHCVIYFARGDLFLRDNNSANGTWLNNEKIEEPRKMQNGDILGIGRGKWSVKFDILAN